MDSELLKKLSKEIHDLKSEVMELRRRPLPLGGGTDEDAIHNNVSGEIAAITEKTSIADNDVLLIEDSAGSYSKKKLLFSRIKTAFNLLFAPLSHVGSGGTAHADVTTSVDGFMTAADKVKLNGLNSANYAPIAHVGSGGAAHADVTTSVDGFMRAADKVKINEINTGAWSSWTPSWSAAGSMTISSVNLLSARYTKMGKTFTFFIDATFTLGGTANNAVILTLPSGISPRYFASCGGWIISGGGLEAAAAYVRDTGVAEARPATGLNWTLGIDKRLSIFGTVELT